MSQARRQTPRSLGKKYDRRIRRYLNGKPGCNLPQGIIDTVDRIKRMAIDKINEQSFDGYDNQIICERFGQQPDAAFLGRSMAILVDWKHSAKNTDYRHQMWRYAKLYERYGNNCLIWVVSTLTHKILQKFKGQDLINKMEVQCYRALRPHMLELDRIRRQAQKTGGEKTNHPCKKYRRWTWNKLYRRHKDQVGYYILTKRPNYQKVAIYYALKKLGLYLEEF